VSIPNKQSGRILASTDKQYIQQNVTGQLKFLWCRVGNAKRGSQAFTVAQLKRWQGLLLVHFPAKIENMIQFMPQCMQNHVIWDGALCFKCNKTNHACLHAK
jgi:hypothetical protein